MRELTLQERWITWLQANRLGFECKIFFGVDDLRIFIIVPKPGAWGPAGRCRHEFDWLRKGEWHCRLCNYLVAAIFWERHGIVLLKSMTAEDVLGLKRE